MEVRKKTGRFRSFLVLSALFLLLVVLVLTFALPQIYPESEAIQTLFGKGKFAVFWLIIIALLLAGVVREQRKADQERNKE